jgi:hypothetical protein
LTSSSRRRKLRKNRSKRRLAYGIAAAFILVGFLAFLYVHSSPPPSPPDVAIVDQVSYFPDQQNQTFVNACENILNKSGLTWVYYKGADVTVDFYRNLPSYATDLIILRVHSAIMRTENGTVSLLGLFTSEPYFSFVNIYQNDVNNGRLLQAWFNESGLHYYAIDPKFIEQSMNGEFKNTIIIMMGCEGLGYINNNNTQQTYTDMAEAFIEKGAKVYLGWNGWVSVNYTDQATLDLLQNLLLKNQTIRNAVGVGKDPYYNSTLTFYPDDAGNYTFQNVESSSTMNIANTSLIFQTPTRSKYKVYRQSKILN